MRGTLTVPDEDVERLSELLSGEAKPEDPGCCG
jgi:hypothetical protein